MRIGDKTIVEIQRKFFDMLRSRNINVEFEEATNANEVFTKIAKLAESEAK